VRIVELRESAALAPEPCEHRRVLFVGDTSFETDDTIRTKGILVGFEAALDTIGFGKLAPAGSTFEVVTYSNGTQVRVRAEPLAEVKGRQLGSEKDYNTGIGTDMVEGIEVAMRDLDHCPAAIKLIYVFGDGNDTFNDGAKDKLDELAAHALVRRIVIDGVIWKTMVSNDEQNLIRRIVPAAKVVLDGPAAAQEFEAAIQRVLDRMYVSFDASAAWDGTPHAFTLRVDGMLLGPVTAQLPDLRRSWWHPGWTQILLGLGIVALVAALLRLRR